MPLYVYRCPSGHESELLQPIGAAAPDRCPTCGASSLERLLSPPLLRFNGSGFYTTDYGPKRDRES